MSHRLKFKNYFAEIRLNKKFVVKIKIMRPRNNMTKKDKQ